MAVLDNLCPPRVWRYFEELCGIPHGSGDTARISDWCAEFARRRGLWYAQDALGNVIIKKPASAGYENHPPVMLQGHLDMVCAKEADCPIDFHRDGLTLRLNGDWVSAAGTTLGGDDGIAVAMILAVLEDTALAHPPLEAVFTVDEETGMDGAVGLDATVLEGRTLINIDSEDEGVLTVSCAGGARAELTLPLTAAPVTAPAYVVTVDGLMGGHSGTQIHEGRQNANQLLGQLLCSLPGEFQLLSLTGGEQDNAIPRRAVCGIAAAQDIAAAAAAFAAAARVETDPGLTVTVEPITAPAMGIAAEDSRRAATFIAAIKSGVHAMSRQIPGLVQTSQNLGVLQLDGTTLRATVSVRSSVNAEKTARLAALEQTAAAYGGGFSAHGHYPAWEYRKHSRLRDVMSAVFAEQYGRTPRVEAIHAGLECGLFSDKLPGLDAVSFGPDMRDVHTPQERLSVSSTARTYRYLCEVLEKL